MRGSAGVERDGKRDELKKHLDRVELLRSELAALAHFVGVLALSAVESHLVLRNPTPVMFALARPATKSRRARLAMSR